MKDQNLDTMRFGDIVKQYQTLVFRTALGFVHVKEDAEDIAQEVFVKAFLKMGQFRGESEVSTWLYRITVNTALSFMDKKNRKGWIDAGEGLLKRLWNLGGGEKNPQQQMEWKEQEAQIRKAMDALPQKQRIAFVLTRFDDLPQKEVAQIMGISQRAVEQLLLRAKINLRKKLTTSIR